MNERTDECRYVGGDAISTEGQPVSLVTMNELRRNEEVRCL